MTRLAEMKAPHVRRLDDVGKLLPKIIDERNLVTLFQPVVDPNARAVFGFEALTRGPSDSWLHSPQRLFEVARNAGRHLELEFLCIELAIERFVRSQAAGQLFLNVSPDCMLSDENFVERLLNLLAATAFAPRRCVIELTENQLLDDYAVLHSSLQRLRQAGCEIAIDDLGAGSSGYRVWAQLRPEYVRIDRYVTSDLDSDATHLGFVRSMIDLGRTIGCRVIAEGVETAEECRELVHLGIDRLQGYLFGRPELQPNAALTHLDSFASAVSTQGALCAEHLAIHVPPVSPNMSVPELVELFRTGTSRDTLAVVEEGRPLGVIRRHDMFALLSKPLHMEIYSRKRVTAIMDTNPLVVDSKLRLEQASQIVTRGSGSKWLDEFLITVDGHYLGIGQTIDLLRKITEQQIQAAKNSNPLTLLPANGPIKDHINRLIAAREAFVVCYVDLDYFKPYNDVYGYARGDQIIVRIAEILRSVAVERLDFVGHVGGDDFVLVMRSTDWCERVQQAQREFTARIRDYYSVEHIADGHMAAADRDGEMHRFPLLSISVAALDSNTSGCVSADAVAELLVSVKKLAKRRVGNSLVLRTEIGVQDVPFRAGV